MGCRGFALTAVIMMAVIFGIAAFGILTMALGARQRSRFHEERLGARYAAEAALVWAQQQLWANNGAGTPAAQGCFAGVPPAGDFCIDDDNNPATPDTCVDVTLTGNPPPCGGANRQLSANVVYQPSP